MQLDRVVITTAVVMQTVPVLGGIAARTGFAGPRLWVGIWCCIGLALDITMRLAQPHNTLWVVYLIGPLMGSAAQYAMAQWQRDEIAGITIRLTIPVALVAWAFAILRVEDPTSFSRVADPMYSILGFGTALFTLGRRGLHEDEPLLRQDWFWLCGGLALYYGKAAIISPLGVALVASRPDIVKRALTLLAVVDIVAYLLLLKGFLCRPTLSGVSSPRSPSPSASWWSPSERPS